MTPGAIIADLARHGIGLRVVRGRLVARPAGLLTGADREALKAHSEAILGLLATCPAPVPRPPGFAVLLPHRHTCPACRREFRCTAPGCAGQVIPCVCCRLARLARLAQLARERAERLRREKQPRRDRDRETEGDA